MELVGCLRHHIVESSWSLWGCLKKSSGKRDIDRVRARVIEAIDEDANVERRKSVGGRMTPEKAQQEARDWLKAKADADKEAEAYASKERAELQEEMDFKRRLEKAQLKKATEREEWRRRRDKVMGNEKQKTKTKTKKKR